MTSMLHSGIREAVSGVFRREAREARVGHGFHEVAQVAGSAVVSFALEAEHGIGPGMDFSVEHAGEMDARNGKWGSGTG